MKFTELRNWENLTEQERARLKHIYGPNPPITKTMHDTNSDSLEKARLQREKNQSDRVNLPSEDSTSEDAKGSHE